VTFRAWSERSTAISSSSRLSRDQASTLSFVTAKQMITWTGEGEGVQVASGLADRTIEVEMLDVKHDIASVLVRSEPYHEYFTWSAPATVGRSRMHSGVRLNPAS
jgi:hypothetical protein